MRNALLKRMPGRHLELLLAALLTLVLIGMMWSQRNEMGGTGIAMTAMEMLLPLALGVAAAGLLAQDPALDILLSAPQAAPRILAQRLITLMAIGAWLGSALQILTYAWEIPLPIEDKLQHTLIWFVPLLLYVGLASAGAMLRGQMIDGVIAATGVWGLSLFSMPLVQERCFRLPPGVESCLAAVASPAMTMLYPLDPGWPLNRAIWLIAGVLLLAASLGMAGREERLVLAIEAE